ncbi:ntA domain-containing protein [Caerostris extrusa]|uniref:NtA domain-containing protein n=1 Tax=Caerostris extrusa TaxID=172846 RepID=A0AAV4Y8W9_CAEEX|nr:ntA domain-containing protein [Caerostris extrusa]
MGLEERAIDSEVVLAAYTRTVHKLKKNSSNSYSAEFLVFNIIKGEDRVVEIYQQRKPSSPRDCTESQIGECVQLGDPSKCESDVNPGETYILLLDVLASGELSARYDGAYGPAVVYSRDKETALEA